MLHFYNTVKDARSFYCPSATWASYKEPYYHKSWITGDGKWSVPSSGKVSGDLNHYFGYSYQTHTNENVYKIPKEVSLVPMVAAYNKPAERPSPGVLMGLDQLYNSTAFPHGRNGDMVNVWYVDGPASTVIGRAFNGLNLPGSATGSTVSQSYVNAINSLEN